MENDWKDDLTSCIEEYKEERAVFNANVSKVIQELAPSKYGVRAMFEPGNGLEISVDMTLNFANIGTMEFKIKKSDLVIKSMNEIGATKMIKPSTPEEYQYAIQQLILTNVKNNLKN